MTWDIPRLRNILVERVELPVLKTLGDVPLGSRQPDKWLEHGFDAAAEGFVRDLVGHGEDLLLDRSPGSRFLLCANRGVTAAGRSLAKKWRQRLPDPPARLKDEQIETDLLLDALAEVGPREAEARDLIRRRLPHLLPPEDPDLRYWNFQVWDPANARAELERVGIEDGSPFDMRRYFEGRIPRARS